ncbi:unnamed protein product, partial [Cylicostephanus goldi]
MAELRARTKPDLVDKLNSGAYETMADLFYFGESEQSQGSELHPKTQTPQSQEPEQEKAVIAVIKQLYARDQLISSGVAPIEFR